MADRNEVIKFIDELKQKIKVFDIAFRSRDKNLKGLADLGLTAHQRIEYILNLNPENYSTGPIKDTHDSSRPEYYEFGIHINHKEVYIKISKGLPDKRVDCMSFHLAEHNISYPLKT